MKTPQPPAAGEPFISFLFPCDDCRADTDPEWWFRSGRLCGDCLANYAMPLTRTDEWMRRSKTDDRRSR